MYESSQCDRQTFTTHTKEQDINDDQTEEQSEKIQSISLEKNDLKENDTAVNMKTMAKLLDRVFFMTYVVISVSFGGFTFSEMYSD